MGISVVEAAHLVLVIPRMTLSQNFPLGGNRPDTDRHLRNVKRELADYMPPDAHTAPGDHENQAASAGS